MQRARPSEQSQQTREYLGFIEKSGKLRSDLKPKRGQSKSKIIVFYTYLALTLPLLYSYLLRESKE
jgi:hypothetical protein